MRERCRQLLLFVLAIWFGIVAIGAQAEAKSLYDQEIKVLQSYVVKDTDEETLTPKVMLYDGENVLEEGKDYTLNLVEDVDGNDDEWEYNIRITGIGDYEDTIMTYTDDCGVVKQLRNWTVLEEIEEEDDIEGCYILSYTGNAVTVTVPYELDGISVDDIYSGVFYQCEKLTTLKLGDFAIKEYLCIDCPALTKITSDCSDDYLDHKPGPIVAGEKSDEVELEVPYDFIWEYDEEETEGNLLTIQDYCKEIEWLTFEDTSLTFQKDGWNFRVDEERDYVVIISYKGTEKKVEVPQKVTFNEDQYEVMEVSEYTFSNLNTLEEIDLGDIPLIASLCKDCPNLKKVTSTNRTDIELAGPIVDGKAPKDNALTVCTFPDVKWLLDDLEEEDEEQETEGETDVEDVNEIRTIQEYCMLYKYDFQELPAEYSFFEIYLKDDTSAIAGDVKKLSVRCEDESVDWDEEDEDWYVDVEDLSATISDWKVLSEDSVIDEEGNITFARDIYSVSEIRVQCVVTLNGESISVLDTITCYPRLVGRKSQMVVLGETKQLNCRQNVYDNEQGVIEQELPKDVEVVYTADDSGIVTVSEDGVVSTTGSAKVGDTASVAAVYTIGEKHYGYLYQLQIVDAKAVPEMDESTIYIYGWEGAGFDKKLENFLDSYPTLADQIQYVPLAFDLEDEDEWKDYKAQIKKAMQTDKAPDIVLWPDQSMAENLSLDYLVPLASIDFDEKCYENAYPYTRGKGTWKNQLYAVTDSVNPGCFMYRKDIAKAVLGTDNPVEVQEMLKDWDTFLETAAKLKVEDLYMLYGLELNYPLFGGKTSPWVEEDALNLDGTVKQYLELQKEIYVNGYVPEDTDTWDYYDEFEYQEDSFGYFVSAEFVEKGLKESGHAGEYAVCAGPVYYSMPGTSYMTATNAGHNNALVKLLLESLVSDQDLLRQITENGFGMVNHEMVMDSFGERDSRYATLAAIAKNIPVVLDSEYDKEIEQTLTYEYCLEMWRGYGTVRISNIAPMDIEDLLEDVQTSLENSVQTLKIERKPESKTNEDADEEGEDSETSNSDDKTDEDVDHKDSETLDTDNKDSENPDKENETPEEIDKENETPAETDKENEIPAETDKENETPAETDKENEIPAETDKENENPTEIDKENENPEDKAKENDDSEKINTEVKPAANPADSGTSDTGNTESSIPSKEDAEKPTNSNVSGKDNGEQDNSNLSQQSGTDTKQQGDSSKQQNNSVNQTTSKTPVHQHSYTAWTVTKEAMCDQPGSKQRNCSTCGNVEKEVIPATGFVKNGIFVRKNSRYKILSVKGKKGTVSWLGLEKNKTKVTLAKTVKAGNITFTVTTIAANACKNNTKLQSITVSTNITKIGKNAFAGCKKLKKITVKSSKIKSVGKNAFKGISKKAIIKVPATQYTKYKKKFSKKGQAKTVKIQ